MIARHHEHSFDLDIIEPGDWVLDVGCRGFVLPAMLSSRGAHVVAVDADPEIDVFDFGAVLFINAAVVHRELAANKKVTLWKHPHDKQAHTVVRPGWHPSGADAVPVDTISIPAIMERFKVQQFALIKLDCEGSEYRLMHDIADAAADGQFWARQISVEFHDHCGLNPHADMEQWYGSLHRRLSPYFDIAKHEREVPPWGGGPHYIDSLYTLRREFWR